MEKLRELLNEFEPYISGDGEHWDNIWLHRTFMSDKTVRENAIRYIVSKEYEFIKWLVDKSKIDLDKIPIRFEKYYQNSEVADYIVEDENILLMLLAISDTPIDLLISILK